MPLFAPVTRKVAKGSSESMNSLIRNQSTCQHVVDKERNPYGQRESDQDLHGETLKNVGFRVTSIERLRV